MVHHKCPLFCWEHPFWLSLFDIQHSLKLGFGKLCFLWSSVIWLGIESFTSLMRSFAYVINSSPTVQNGRHFADDSFKRIFINEKCFISIRISLKFAPEGPIDNKAALVQLMAWCWTGHYLDQCWPSLPTHICNIRGRWVNSLKPCDILWHYQFLSTLVQVI